MEQTNLHSNPTRIFENGVHDFGELRLIRQIMIVRNTLNPQPSPNAFMIENVETGELHDFGPGFTGIYSPKTQQGEPLTLHTFHVFGLDAGDVLQILFERF